VVTKTRSPTADLLSVDVSPQRQERTRRMVQRVWESIQAGLFYPAPSAMSCAGCPYREPCRQWPDV
jgi:CRISPR/Cas system-associated exonuclease Cas4 (RecB family)